MRHMACSQGSEWKQKRKQLVEFLAVGMAVAEGIICTSLKSHEGFTNQIQFVQNAGASVKRFANLLLLAYGKALPA